MRIGGHVSAAVSLERAFIKGHEIGADCIQFFISPPQQWIQTAHSDEEIERFKKVQIESGIGPNFIHGTYLVNLGTQSPEHLQKSIDWLIYAMRMAANLEVEGVIFHTGSHSKRGFETVVDQIAKALTEVLQKASLESSHNDKKPYLVLETSAGAGGSIGGTFSELGKILKQVQHDRLKICLDTQHVFAAGYDLRTPLTMKDVIAEFDQEIGLKNLVAIHANDSKMELSSGRDRHENIGEGFIGRDGFTTIVNQPELKEVPFLLEVPGFSGNGPDQENIQLLKSLFGELH